MILNQAQAEAVYSAMCALNNVNAEIDTFVGDIRVLERGGVVRVFERGFIVERHSNQAAFAAAYGLQQV